MIGARTAERILRAIRAAETCATKRAYRSKRAAKRAAKRPPRRRVYHCPWCRFWHLTSNRLNGGKIQQQH